MDRLKRFILHGLLAGVVAGCVLGFFLKTVQAFTGIKVYTLLLNIDFLPKVQGIPLSEVTEFMIHLSVSVIIGIIYGWIVSYFPNKRGIVAFFITLPAFLLYFPLSILAKISVPPVESLSAITWWAAGHFLYALTLFGWMKIATFNYS